MVSRWYGRRRTLDDGHNNLSWQPFLDGLDRKWKTGFDICLIVCFGNFFLLLNSVFVLNSVLLLFCQLFSFCSTQTQLKCKFQVNLCPIFFSIQTKSGPIFQVFWGTAGALLHFLIFFGQFLTDPILAFSNLGRGQQINHSFCLTQCFCKTQSFCSTQTRLKCKFLVNLTQS